MLYEVITQAIKGADRSGIVKAIGEQLAGPLVVLIALVDQDGKVDSASAWTPSQNQAIPASIPTHRTTLEPATRITSYNVCYTKLLGVLMPMIFCISASRAVL